MNDERPFRFNFQQDNPALLCAHRKLRTSEIHGTNDFYGQASVLKRYAGLPQGYSLKGVLEHGLNLDDQMWRQDRDACLHYIFSASGWRARVHQTLSDKTAVPIGFGYLYAMRLVEDRCVAVARRRGTLVFPCHSTQSITARFNHADFALRICSLPSNMQPVVVCIYWKNYHEDEHRVYEERGLPVVTAGHMYDPDFLLRFHDLCRNFRYAAANAVGTHVFQAVTSGCRFFYLPSSEISWDIPSAEQTNTARHDPLFQSRERQIKQLFCKPLESVSNEQQAFVDYFLGTKFMYSRAALRRLFLSLEWEDKVRPMRGANHPPWASPFVARKLARFNRVRNSLKKRLPWNTHGKAA